MSTAEILRPIDIMVTITEEMSPIRSTLMVMLDVIAAQQEKRP